MSFAERMEQAQEEREKKSAAAAKEREKMAALKKKEDEAKARELAAKKKKDEAEKKALAAKKAREEAAEKKAREQELAKRKAEEEKKREARLAARQKAEEERESRRREQEVAAAAERSGGGGFFNQLTVTTPTKYKSKGHKIYVNRAALAGLNPSNAKIEIDLSDQKARIYKSNGGNKQLVIETQVSTGKSGHGTPTGSYRISEKKVEKRSTLYGSWVNSSGSTVRSSGEAWSRPSGASRFVGAEMPYWMRVNGGIGMHVGYVPDYPASHGCIRVPSSVQPLIYSKVGVGTQVTIRS
ncbi:MAG: L,D-transpeptidase family protein [Verrucomicrobiota bacterium]